MRLALSGIGLIGMRFLYKQGSIPSLSNCSNSVLVRSSVSMISLSCSESVCSNVVLWRCGCWLEGVGVVAGVRDFLAGAVAEFSILVWAIVWRVSAAVFAASTASWYSLSNLFYVQELVM